MKVISDIKACAKLFLQQNKKRKAGPIRVGFMCQYVPAWNKIEAVYSAMLEDADFEPIIICIPPNINNSCLDEPESLSNETYDYYIENGYSAVNALIGKEEWLDLKTLELDFVFYLRPYDWHMPMPYTSGKVSKYSKVCIVLYGITIVNEDMDIVMVEGFFRNTFCYFAEFNDNAIYNKKRFPLAHFLRLQKSVTCGIPAFSSILEAKGSKSEIWDFYNSNFKILWTPRWTTKPELGGSNFFNYKDWILDYAQAHKDTSIVLRPHPLAFDNFIKSGEMTKEEADNYKKRCKDIRNTYLDTSKTYMGTMWQSDVMIGDYSGILPEYFLIGKPLIFCKSNFTLHPTPFFKKMLQGCYVVENKEELEECIENLRQGVDRLKETRKKLVAELFGDNIETAPVNILSFMKKEVK